MDFSFSPLQRLHKARVAPAMRMPPRRRRPAFLLRMRPQSRSVGGCHQKDKDGNLSRISWIRTTPEGWQEAIKRMVRINGLTLQPAEARQVLKYLSNNHGLAPEEAVTAAWYNEKRQIEAEKLPNDNIRDTCGSCHPIARPQSWHRSPKEWTELANMHIGYFPVAEFNAFRRRTPPTPGAAPAAAAEAGPRRDAIDIALEYWSKTNVLHSPEWANWQASMREPKLSGRWLVSAKLPGKGKFFGEMQVEPGAAPGEFTTSTRLTSLSTGQATTMKGKSTVYSGFEWRGRATGGDDPEIREVMSVSRDQSKMEGRAFWGFYQEFGYDFVARRAGNDPVVLGTDIGSLQAGSTANKIKIYGDNMPGDVTLADIDLGMGVTAKKINSKSASLIEVEADVDAKAVSGMRDVVVRRAAATGSYAVYDKIDYIKVTSDSTIARLGGVRYKKGFVQFEAHAWHRGLDGKVNTPDDVDLGTIPVKWSMEEFISRYDDDDTAFVGSLSATTGLFTPGLEGPNPKRKFISDNYGDVWIVASYQPKGAEKPLTGRSYLVVTVPAYVRYDQPEVAQ